MLFPLAAGMLNDKTEPLRTLCLQKWRGRLRRELCGYMTRTHGKDWGFQLTIARRMKQTGGLASIGLENTQTDPHHGIRELLRDAEVGEDAISKAADSGDKCKAKGAPPSGWWSWDKGSTLFFWRWPAREMRRAARDGMQPYIQSSLPNYHVRAKQTKSDVYGLLLPKLQKIIARGYVEIGFRHDFLKSYIDYFIVPKADDVRPVYNGTSCGLNEAVWAPHCWLPTAKSATRVLDYNYCGVDIDLGEMFLNFSLLKVYRQFSGIDLGQFKSDLGEFLKAIPRRLLGVRWERCWMGFRPSPYYAVRFYSLLGTPSKFRLFSYIVLRRTCTRNHRP
jgi:hypothetical protein